MVLQLCYLPAAEHNKQRLADAWLQNALLLDDALAERCLASHD